MYDCTCHTEGCENADKAIRMMLDQPDPDTGETVHVTSVVCGACGNPIDDVTAAA